MGKADLLRYVIRSFAAAVAIIFFLRFFVLDIYKIEGKSMEPFLKQGRVILVNKAAYGIRIPYKDIYLFRWAKPEKNDIVVFEEPENGLLSVKRCIQSTLGKKAVLPLGGGVTLAPYTMYVIGDNYAYSLDSRTFGPLPLDSLVGRVIQ